MSFGYEIIYPGSCKEVNSDLSNQELLKRLCHLENSLCSEVNENSVLDESIIEEDASSKDCEKYKGLLIYLGSTQFTKHKSIQIRLKTATCLLHILNIFCPLIPYTNMPDEKLLIESVLEFFLLCLESIHSLQSRDSAFFQDAVAIYSGVVQMNIVCWCLLIEKRSEIFHKYLVFMIKSLNNFDVWSWNSFESTSADLHECLHASIRQDYSLMSLESLEFICSYLIDPNMSLCPKQYNFCVSFLLRNGEKMDDLIQELVRKCLEIKPSINKGLDENELIEEDDDKESDLLSSKHIYSVLYALHSIKTSLITSSLSIVAVMLKNTDAKERRKAFRFFAKIFAESESTFHFEHVDLWNHFVQRFKDADKENRLYAIQVLPVLWRSNSQIEHKNLLKILRERIIDSEKEIRLLNIQTIQKYIKDNKGCITKVPLSEDLVDLINSLINRIRDKELDIRKISIATLGSIYKVMVNEILEKDVISTQLDYLLGNIITNILRHRYLKKVEDNIQIERTFKLCLIPFDYPSDKRSKALRFLIDLIPDKEINSLIDIFASENSMAKIVKDFLKILNANAGNEFPPDIENLVLKKISILSDFFPKNSRVSDHILKFFNMIRVNENMRKLMNELYLENLSVKENFNKVLSINDLFPKILTTINDKNKKKDSSKISSISHTVKILIERSSNVLIDKDFYNAILDEINSKKTTLIDQIQRHHSDKKTDLSKEVKRNLNDLKKSMEMLFLINKFFNKKTPFKEIMKSLHLILDTIDSFKDLDVKQDLRISFLQIQEITIRVIRFMFPIRSIFSSKQNCPPMDPVEIQSFFQNTEIPESTLQLTKYLIKYTTEIPHIKSDSTKRNIKVSLYKTLCHRSKYSIEILGNLMTIVYCKIKANGSISRFENIVNNTNLLPAFENISLSSPPTDDGLVVDYEKALNDCLKDILDLCLDDEFSRENLWLQLYTLSCIMRTFPKYAPVHIHKLIPSLLSFIFKEPRTDSNDEIDNHGGVFGKRKPIDSWSSDNSMHDLLIICLTFFKLFSSSCIHSDEGAIKKLTPMFFQLINRTIKLNGFINGSITRNDGDSARIRYAALCGYLKCSQANLHNLMSVDDHYKLLRLIGDPSSQLRHLFFKRLTLLLKQLKLSISFLAVFVLFGLLKLDKEFKTRAICNFKEIMEIRKHIYTFSKKNRPTALFEIMNENILIFVIHFLAHDTNWKMIDDRERLVVVKKAMWYVLEPLMASGADFSLVRKLIESLKHYVDATNIEDEILTKKNHICCDIALGLLLTRCSNVKLSATFVDPIIPNRFYRPAPINFVNQDFAQLFNEAREPIILFTPHKTKMQDSIPKELMKPTKKSRDGALILDTPSKPDQKLDTVKKPRRVDEPTRKSLRSKNSLNSPCYIDSEDEDDENENKENLGEHNSSNDEFANEEKSLKRPRHLHSDEDSTRSKKTMTDSHHESTRTLRPKNR